MKVLFISIDSLRRDCLGAYEPSIDLDIKTPNLDRFAEKAATFETHYAGSLPCMPARREWLTGTQEFLWRPWGPIEPFDKTITQLARKNGILTQLITDHYHYFEHGSSRFYEDFNGFNFIRGQERDALETTPKDVREEEPDLFDQLIPNEETSFFTKEMSDLSSDEDSFGVEFMNRWQGVRNLSSLYDADEEKFFTPRMFRRTREWLQENREWDNWFLYMDNYEAHEPFLCPQPYASMYTDEDPRDPDLPLWPFYGRTDEGQSELTDRQIDFVRSQYAGNLTMFDEYFGELLETLDEESLWSDTMVVVTSDHGYLLGEHNWMGKMDPPVYDILANTPLFIWHPDSPMMGERISALTSAVDIYQTINDALVLAAKTQCIVRV